PAVGTVLAEGGNQSLTVAFTPSDASNYVATSKTVTVSVQGVPRVTASATTVAPAGTVIAVVTNGPANRTDWVALYPLGGSSYIDWKYLNDSQIAPASGLGSGAVTFTMPIASGTYVLKFFTGSTLLATSDTITVDAPTLSLSATTVAPGGVVSAHVANGPGNRTDWIGVHPLGNPAYVEWTYLSGSHVAPTVGLSTASVDIAMPTTPGLYQLRFYAGGTLLATSATISVSAPVVTVTVNPSTIGLGGTVTAVVAGAPGQRTDWLGLYPTGATTYLNWVYLNGSQTAPPTGV